MPELGRTLSQARVSRGLTLEDCERDTRISKRYLDALEREDWKVFPAPVYSRAFLRTYSQYLGLNPAELMRLFQSQTEEPIIRPLPEVTAAPSTANMNVVLAGVVLVLLLFAGAFLFFSRGGGDGGENVTNNPVPTIATEGQGGGVQQPGVGRPVPEIKEGEVPDLTGVRSDDAILALEQAGLNYVIVETDDTDGATGVVASQDPPGGTKGGSKTSVTLVVPRG
ncbi:MAG TPA: helix-turn-helix domain-containing protein [Dehalococcoidia bacterium]|nr:helix-turn-helix domain-containing protein [Dehalococcoidia bacterium]